MEKGDSPKFPFRLRSKAPIIVLDTLLTHTVPTAFRDSAGRGNWSCPALQFTPRRDVISGPFTLQECGTIRWRPRLVSYSSS